MILYLLLLLLHVPIFPAEFTAEDIEEADAYCDTVSAVTKSNIWSYVYHEISQDSCKVLEDMQSNDELGPRVCGSLHCACIGDNVFGICLHKTRERGVRVMSYKDCEFLGDPEDRATVSETVNENLRVDFISEEDCDVGHLQGKKRYTLTLMCDTSVNQTEPQYTGGGELCHHHFVWRTADVCREQGEEAQSMREGFCKLIDPQSEADCDLSYLADMVLRYKSGNGSDLYFSICGHAKMDGCAPESGACTFYNDGRKPLSGGETNGRLIWKKSRLYLNYTGGDPCAATGLPRYTVIQLLCGQNVEISVKEKTCYTFIRLTAICPHGCGFVMARRSTAIVYPDNKEDQSMVILFVASFGVTLVVYGLSVLYYYYRDQISLAWARLVAGIRRCCSFRRAAQENIEMENM